MKRTNLVPALVGSVLMFLGVAVIGNRWFQEEIVLDVNQRWVRSLASPMRWDLVPPDRVDFDQYVGTNLFPGVLVVATALFLCLATRRRDGWNFWGLLFAGWGSVIGATIVASVVYEGYIEVVLDTRAIDGGFGGGYLDRLHSVILNALDGPAIGGLFIGFAVAVTGAILGGRHGAPVPANAYAGSPVDPAPPFEPTGVMPAAAPAPTAATPASTPPPPPPPPPVADDDSSDQTPTG